MSTYEAFLWVPLDVPRFAYPSRYSRYSRYKTPYPWNPYRVPISDNFKKYSKKGLTAARILVNFEKSRGTERTAKNKKGFHRSPLYRLTRQTPPINLNQ